MTAAIRRSTPRVRWEPFKRGPVLIKAVEEFRMNWVAILEPPLVVGISAVSGELAPVLSIEIGKGPTDGISGYIIGYGLKEPS